MSNTKRLLALILALAMVFSLTCGSFAYADDDVEIVEEAVVEENEELAEEPELVELIEEPAEEPAPVEEVIEEAAEEPAIAEPADEEPADEQPAEEPAPADEQPADADLDAEENATFDADAEGISLNKTKLVLAIGAEETLTATLTPADAEGTVTWTSSDESIATVDEGGKVTGVAVGSATITAKLGDTLSATCAVTVVAEHVHDVIVNQFKGGKQEVFTFNEWSASDSLPTVAGNYYLTTDVTLTETWVAPKNTSIDLHGYTISAGGLDIDVIRITDGVLKIFDCVGTGTITGGKNGVYVAAGGHVNVALNMYEGTITGNSGFGVTGDGLDWGFNCYHGPVRITGNGGGVRVWSANGDPRGVYIDVVGDVIIADNANGDVVFDGDKFVRPIFQLGPLSENSRIGISSNVPRLCVDISERFHHEPPIPANAEVYADRFFSNDPEWAIIKTPDGTYVAAPVAGITLNKETTTISVNSSETLTATVTPEDALAVTLTWSSSDEAIATVDKNGKVTAKAEGIATITATSADGSVSASCVVTTYFQPVESITLNEESMTLFTENSDGALSATVAPNNASNKTVAWTSSDESVATVDANGNVTAVAVGTATITATTTDGSELSASCVVTVKSISVDYELPYKIIKNGSSLWDYYIGGGTLDVPWADIAPEGIVLNPDNWYEFAVVSDLSELNRDYYYYYYGPFYAGFAWNEETYQEDRTIIEVTAGGMDGTPYPGIFYVAMRDPDDYNKWIPLFGFEAIPVVTVDKGVSSDYRASTLMNCSEYWSIEDFNQNVTMTNPDTDKATAEAVMPQYDQVVIRVTGVEAGRAKVAGTYESSYYDNQGNYVTGMVETHFYVDVIDTKLTLSEHELTIKNKDSATLTATYDPADWNEYRGVTWSSSDTSVATVDKNGKVTGVYGGTATITATSANMEGHAVVTDSCVVTVDWDYTTGMTLDQHELNIKNTDSAQLTALFEPEDAFDKTVTWTSSDTRVAKVDKNGKVTGVYAGTATITASNSNGVDHEVFTDSCTVTVDWDYTTGLTLDQHEIAVTGSGTVQLNATIEPEDAFVKTVTWTSSDTGVATVDKNGKVTIVAPGVATITASNNNGVDHGILSDTCVITADYAPVETVTLDRETLALNDMDGLSATLVATITPEDPSYNTRTWKSSDTAIATVDANGKVTGVATGTATVTVISANGKSASCEVTVTRYATALALNQTAYTLSAGSDYTLIPTLTHASAVDKNLSWTSSDEEVATVDENGKVTGVAPGTATITCTNTGEFKTLTKTCAITVVESETHTHDSVVFTAWESADSLPTAGGSYYLTTDVELTASWHPAANVRLCLNGHTITGGGRDINVITIDDHGWGEGGSDFVLYDCVGTGVITGGTNGIYLNDHSWGPVPRFLMYGGTITGNTGYGILPRGQGANGGGDYKIMLYKGTITGNGYGVKVDNRVWGRLYIYAPGEVVVADNTNGNVMAANNNSNERQVAFTRFGEGQISPNARIGITRAPGVFTSSLAAHGDASIFFSDNSDYAVLLNQNGEAMIGIPATELTLDKTEMTIVSYASESLTATVTPSEGTNKTLAWTSSDETVAAVDANGKVTGRGVGTAVITATTTDGSNLSASCTVTVTMPVMYITLDKTTLDFNHVGNTETLTATVKYDDAADKSVTWTSSNANVATVDQNGVVTAVAEGTATIKVTANDGSGKSASCAVTVSLPSYEVTFNANGGSEIDPVTVKEGAKLTEPAAPTKDGVNFYGWYKDEELTEEWDFEQDTVTADITLYAKWTEGETAKIGKTISLDDSIRINARIRDLSHPDHLEYYHLNAVYKGETMADGTLAELMASGEAELRDNRYIVLIADSVAKEMIETVHVVFSYVEDPENPKVIDEFDYSVQAYCESMIQATSNQALIDLCTATLDYGAYAQLHFGYRTDVLANANYTAGEDVIQAVTVPEKYNITKDSGACTGIISAGKSTNLLSATELWIRFKPEDPNSIANYSFTVNGSPVEAAAESSRFIVKITGVAAPKLDTVFTVTVTNNNDNTTMTVTYSAMAYAYNMHTSAGTGGMVTKAFYRYFDLAKAYFG